MRLLCLLCTAILLTGCASNLVLKKDIPLSELSLCVSYNPNIPEEIRAKIDNVTDDFIQSYNSEGHKFKLAHCKNYSVKALNISIDAVRITTPGLQATGVFVTTVGCITPIALIASGAPFYIWFAYLPRTYAQMGLTLTQDIAETNNIRRLYPQSGRYFGSVEEQTHSLLNNYYFTLRKEICKLELQSGDRALSTEKVYKGGDGSIIKEEVHINGNDTIKDKTITNFQ
jgi:hypothetical protein